MFSWFGKVSFVPCSKVQEFTVHLREGRLMGSVCKRCGYTSFPPRADCPKCLSAEFSFRQISGQGTLCTYSTVQAAPTGFEDMVPYTLGVVDLEEGGRLLAWVGDSIPASTLQIGMDVRVVPRASEKGGQPMVYYTIEKTGS